MDLWKSIKSLFASGGSAPPDAPRLKAGNESELSVSLRALPDGEPGWITLSEARYLFSHRTINTPSERWMMRENLTSANLPRRVSTAHQLQSCLSKGAFTSLAKQGLDCTQTVEWGELSFKVVRLEKAGQEVLGPSCIRYLLSPWPTAEIELRQGARVT
jgi:hypothetical protein